MSDHVIDIVCSYPKFVERFGSEDKNRRKAEKVINEIHGEFSESLVRSSIKVVDSTFAKLYDDILLEVVGQDDVKDLAQKNHVILVPNHQSHADYIAITYAFFKKFELPLFIAGGINLNIFPIGNYFRRAGAFFIRRSFNSDIFYKTCFEAYLYYLLKTNRIIEFFFEGGRTRTGKLLKPRYGLFQMLLEANSFLEDEKPLAFIPVSIAHEHIPEEKAHAREFKGAKKVPEKAAQLLKVFKLANKKLGTIHIRLGQALIVGKDHADFKLATQELAFSCFKSVGDNMPITPSALLGLILLDEPSGAVTWKQIETKAKAILSYCETMKIPLVRSLSTEKSITSIQTALNMFIANKKIEIIRRDKLNLVFYALKAQERIEVLFHKNMILHHFIVPGFINAAWFNIFNGNVKTPQDLTKFLQVKRQELRYEFYLPTVKEMVNEALKIISYSLGRKVEKLEECLSLNSQDLYLLASKVRHFSTAFCYIYEAYYLCGMSVRYFESKTFSLDEFLQAANEIFQLEIQHGRVIKYHESYSVNLLKDSMNYLIQLKVLEKVGNKKFKVVDRATLDDLVEKFVRDLNDQVTINLKFAAKESHPHV